MNKLIFEKDTHIIFLLDSKSSKWVDKTASINAIYKAYRYKNFTGYNVYFYNGKNRFFYVKENVRICEFIKDIPIGKQKLKDRKSVV